MIVGTAPAEDQHPAMPDPDRLVRRSIAMLVRLGMNREKATEVVFGCSITLAQTLASDDQWVNDWLQQLFDAAIDAVGCLRPSINDSKDDENADGRSSGGSGH